MWSSVTERRIGTAGVSAGAGSSSRLSSVSVSKTASMRPGTSVPLDGLFDSWAVTICVVSERSSLRVVACSSDILRFLNELFGIGLGWSWPE